MTDIPGMASDHLRYPNLLEMLEIPDKRTGTMAIKAEFHERIVQAKDRMLRRGRWKLVYQPLEAGYRLRLYDVETDPGCMTNLCTKHPEIVGELWPPLQQIIASDPGCSSAPFLTSTRNNGDAP